MRRHALLGSIVFAFAILLSAASPATAAAIVTQPFGLSPGDQYRLAFVTGGLRNAKSRNIADYNAFVTLDANRGPALAALGTTWNVIGSTAAVHAFDNTHTNPFTSDPSVPIYRLDGRQVASGNSGLWSGRLGATISINPRGGSRRTLVWTGTNSNGKGLSPLGSRSVTLGRTDRPNAFWVAGPTQSNFFPGRFYGISGVLTVPGVAIAPVPEPGSFILLSIGAFCLVGEGLRRRKRTNKSS